MTTTKNHTNHKNQTNHSSDLIPQLRFPEFVNNGEWEEKTLADIINEFIVPMRDKPKKLDGEIPWCRIEDFNGMYLENSKSYQGVSFETIKEMNLKVYPINTLLVSCSANLGICAITRIPLITNQTFIGLVSNENLVDVKFLYFLMSKSKIELNKRSSGTTISYLSKNEFEIFNIVLPYSLPEQQKIADCLSSLDEVIEAEKQRLEQLKRHKKALLQNLFPQQGEKVPKLRFPEFADSGEWKEKTIEKIAKVTTGGTPESTNIEYWNGTIPWMNSGELNKKRIYTVDNFITEKGFINSSTKLIPPFCILIGLAGQGKTRGTAAINYIELCTNQSIGSIHPNNSIFESEFLYQLIDCSYDRLRLLSTGDGGRGGLNLQIIKEFLIKIPSLPEQEKIANCLSSLDEMIQTQTERIEQLKQHKKGLLQNLFPRMRG